jgi:hypothetical protein
MHYFMVPDEERAARIHESDDLCVIDGAEFFIRGVVEVPNREGGPGFEWGPWALISEREFEYAHAHWDQDCSSEPPFRGSLSMDPPGYNGLFMVPVLVQLRTPTLRPLFTFPADSEHRLAREQRTGVTPAEWHAIVATVMPWLFGRALRRRCSFVSVPGFSRKLRREAAQGPTTGAVGCNSHVGRPPGVLTTGLVTLANC